MMTAWRLACQAARLPGMICALMDEAVYFCFGNCVAAQRPAKQAAASPPGWAAAAISDDRGAQVQRSSQVWPVQPSSARHDVWCSRLMRGESFQPSGTVPPADAKMQIPSCQMRFSAGWTGAF